jgi:hypothetical protein
VKDAKVRKRKMYLKRFFSRIFIIKPTDLVEFKKSQLGKINIFFYEERFQNKNLSNQKI